MVRKSVYEQTRQVVTEKWKEEQEELKITDEEMPLQEIVGKNGTASESASKICSSCDENSVAEYYCKECEEMLCDACHNAHLRVKITRSHIQIPL